MKIVVSYINSIYDSYKTIQKIDECSAAYGIHVDLMDGLYVPNKNFEIRWLPSLFKNTTKPLDIHLMTNKPTKYFNTLFSLKPECIYIHPHTESDPVLVFKYLQEYGIKPGLVINPQESISEFSEYFPYVKRVLLMSVTPGAGGQTFLENTPERLTELKKWQAKYAFEIFIDGGINSDTIKLVSAADGVVSGSFVCKSPDFNSQIIKLKNNLKTK